MERQVLQVCSLGSFAVVGLRLDSSKLLTAQNTRRGCARWFTKNIQCESPGRLHYSSNIKLWAVLLQEHLPTSKDGEDRHGAKDGARERLSPLQTWMCVINTYPKATTASMCNMLVSVIPTACKHPHPNTSWQVKAKE